MVWISALVLAVLQGVTEFLPVSSSGHLALAQMVLPGVEPDVAFDVLLHVATVVAILVYFRADLLLLLSGLWAAEDGSGSSSPFAGAERRTVGLLAVATVVTGFLGLALQDPAEAAFRDPFLVGGALLLTAILVSISGVSAAGDRGIREFSWWRAAAVGAAQGLAVFPGLSRSGATIAACLLLGLDRDTSVRFSLLLSVPAIFGAFLLKLPDLEASQEQWGPAVAACLLTAVVGYASIHLLVGAVREGWFRHFAWYCAALGLLAILLALLL